MPKVSIGLPVFNGERYLAEAIESILNQSFTDFELIISDNGSTDKTHDICMHYKNKDERVIYFRNNKNIGAAENYNKVFEIAQGRFFKWAAHDDVLGPRYLKNCLEVLDCDNSVVFCHSLTGKIDENGELVGDYDHEMRLMSSRVYQRFHDLIVVRHPCVLAFGICRSEILRKTPLIGKYVGSDRVLLGEIGMYGKIYVVPKMNFFRRCHPETSGFINEQERIAWFDPQMKGIISFPNWRILGEHARSIRRVEQKPVEKMLCYAQIFPHFRKRRRFLLLDLEIALKMKIRPTPFGRMLVGAKRVLRNNCQKVDWLG